MSDTAGPWIRRAVARARCRALATGSTAGATVRDEGGVPDVRALSPIRPGPSPPEYRSCRSDRWAMPRRGAIPQAPHLYRVGSRRVELGGARRALIWSNVEEFKTVVAAMLVKVRAFA